MCFTPEQRADLLKTLGKPADATDADLTAALVADWKAVAGDYAAEHKRADEAAAEVTALSATVAHHEATISEGARVIAELTAAKEAADKRVMDLSAGGGTARDIDPMALALINRSFKTDREAVVASGVISEAGMKEIDTLLGVGGGKSVALSLSAGGTDPLYSRLCDIIRRNPGIATNNAVKRDGLSTAPPPHFPSALDLSGAAGGKGGGGQDDDDAKDAADWQARQAASRGLAPLGK